MISKTILSNEKRLGIKVDILPRLGDKIQFSSLPENYYLATGRKLIDVDRSWMFDYNPYVERDVEPDIIVDLWHEVICQCPSLFKFQYPSKRQYFTSQSERNVSFFGIPLKLGHPRLYRFENQPIKYNTTIGPYGLTNPPMNEKIINHILETRKDVAQVGLKSGPAIAADYDLRSDNIWDAVEAIASSRECISNSGLSLIAACYPRVWNKMVLTQFSEEQLLDYLPMGYAEHTTHWHDHRYAYYNNFEFDVGISISYLKI